MREEKYEGRVGVVLLAAGSRSRMHSETPKQYMMLAGKPLLAHSLLAFEASEVDAIVLVVAAGDEVYCQREIVEKYSIKKVSAIVAGGQERYDSVYCGLQQLTCDYVLIHDAARAFVTPEIITGAAKAAQMYGAAVVGMPSKDTIKISDEEGFVASTPHRELVWNIQTPQAFYYPLVYEAYQKLQDADCAGITDDAMVVERMTDTRVKLILGSYENIKVTTPEDLALGESILAARAN